MTAGTMALVRRWSQSAASGPCGSVGVLHLIDSLAVGGAERMAVNIVNRLPRDRFTPHLCTTRSEGPLAAAVAADVGRLALHRRARVDLHAMRRLRDYLRAHHVRVVHAHGSAVFVASLATLGLPDTHVVWHVHYGRYATEPWFGWLYRAVRGRVRYAVAASETLATWAAERVGIDRSRVAYLPNFVAADGMPRPARATARAACLARLPGADGERIVCVANFTPEKDHVTLVEAMARVAAERPRAHLLLLGAPSDARCAAAVRDRVAALGLGERVHLLGQRHDVRAVLGAADVAVLSSRAEGTPLALLEYGHAGVAVVVTCVGQCAAAVGYGEAGVIVPPGDAGALARSLVALLRSPERRARLGAALQRHVRAQHDPERVIRRLGAVYARLF